VLVVHTWEADEYEEEELLTGPTTDELELGCLTGKEELGKLLGPDWELDGQEDELRVGGAVVLDVWTEPTADELVLLEPPAGPVGLRDGGGLWEPDGGGGMVVLPKDVTAFGMTLVQSVS
jgi:hypothetical protein